MVLPEWIEHSTSPLPRGCSTTELRQQRRRGLRAGANAAETAISRAVDARQSRLAKSACRRIIAAMTRTGNGDAKPVESTSRERRLAAALRENLRRRKAQARERGATTPETDKTKKEDEGR